MKKLIGKVRRISVIFFFFKGGNFFFFKMKPRPLESLWKTLPGPKWGLSLKLGKLVEIGSKKI